MHSNEQPISQGLYSCQLLVDHHCIPVEYDNYNVHVHVVHIVLGRWMDSVPNRKNNSKWYIPYSVYPRKYYPKWYQGLIYFLSPSLAADLFFIAQHTPYMFIDDVFMGIVVDKLAAEQYVNLVTVNQLSRFKRSIMKPSAWVEVWKKDSAPFYHVPNVTQYLPWYSEGQLTWL